MPEISPHQQIGQMLSGYWLSQAIYVAARLDLADRLAIEPQDAEQLAAATDTHPPSLYRLLRALASVGIFAEDAQHRFALTPLAECLRKGLPGSQRDMALMLGEEHYQAWGELLYSVRTGRTGFEKVFGKPIFDYLSEHPEQGAVFDGAMVSIHGRETAAMLDAYDFSPFGTLADIGGGNGSLLCEVLGRNPQLRGILFDLPGVVARAAAKIEAAGLKDRLKTAAGSFFGEVVAGADAYLLRHIIHDWDDERSMEILLKVHAAMPAGGKLLVVESVIPPGNEPNFGKLLDLTMLVIPGGKERTAEQYRELFKTAGFQLTRIVPTAAEVSVIEGVKLK